MLLKILCLNSSSAAFFSFVALFSLPSGLPELGLGPPQLDLFSKFSSSSVILNIDFNFSLFLFWRFLLHRKININKSNPAPTIP